MADVPADPALKAAAEKLADVVSTLSAHAAPAGSAEMRQVQMALNRASNAYAAMLRIGQPEPASGYDPYW